MSHALFLLRLSLLTIALSSDRVEQYDRFVDLTLHQQDDGVHNLLVNPDLVSNHVVLLKLKVQRSFQLVLGLVEVPLLDVDLDDVEEGLGRHVHPDFQLH